MVKKFLIIAFSFCAAVAAQETSETALMSPKKQIASKKNVLDPWIPIKPLQKLIAGYIGSVGGNKWVAINRSKCKDKIPDDRFLYFCYSVCSPDGKYLLKRKPSFVTCNGLIIWTPTTDDGPLAYAFSSNDNSRLALADSKTVSIFDLITGRLVQQVPLIGIANFNEPPKLAMALNSLCILNGSNLIDYNMLTDSSVQIKCDEEPKDLLYSSCGTYIICLYDKVIRYINAKNKKQFQTVFFAGRHIMTGSITAHGILQVITRDMDIYAETFELSTELEYDA